MVSDIVKRLFHNATVEIHGKYVTIDNDVYEYYVTKRNNHIHLSMWRIYDVPA